MVSVSKLALGGQIQGSGAWSGTFATDNAMFLKVFAGEVMAAYDKYNVTADKHRIRTIQSGKSAQFPFTGRAAAGRFTPGSDILVDNFQAQGAGPGAADTTPSVLSNIKVAETVINIDDLLLSSCFIDDLDLAKSHYDYRGPFSRELGRAIAHEFDKNVLGAALVSAAANTGAADPYQTSQHDTTSIAAADDISSTELLTAIYAAAQGFDERYVPDEDRYVFVRPAEYYKLVKDSATGNGTALLHRDYTNAGNGDFAEGFVLKAGGMTVVKTPHLQVDDDRSDDDGTGGGTDMTDSWDGEHNDYRLDAELTVALCWHPEAVGTVKLKDMTMESEYLIARQGNLLVAKMACGHKGLRPECVARIDAAAAT